MVTQEELNLRIVEDAEKMLLIFRNQADLDWFKRNGTSTAIMVTEDNLRSKLVGLRYYNWRYFDENDMKIMKDWIKSQEKESDVK